MRIIAGSLKGRRIELPADSRARPTPDRAREALFSILGERVPGATILDLFAGSGSIGFEAISRGARSVLFVESGLAEAKALKANAARFGIEDRAELFRGSAAAAITRLRDGARRFSLVFADPPWDLEGGLDVALDAGVLVEPGGVQVVELEVPHGVERIPAEGWSIRRYGRVAFALRHAAESPSNEGGGILASRPNGA